MRLQLQLLPPEKTSYIPINYQYQLSSALYQILAQSSAEYATFLHDRGYIGADGKVRKLFTFSKLFFQHRVQRRDNFLRIEPRNRAWLIVASPMLEDFMQHFVVGLFTRQRIPIYLHGRGANFQVMTVERLPEPEFRDTMRFVALSPLTLSTVRERNGRRYKYYYRALDEGLPEAVRKNLIEKYRTIYQRMPEDAELDFSVDQSYFARTGDRRFGSKNIAIREGYADETRVIGFKAPFTLTGSKELIRLAYDGGIGEKTALGFGCVDIVKSQEEE